MQQTNSSYDIEGCGVVYVGFGIPYLLQALHSYRTLRFHNPDIPVQIITNVLSYTSEDPLLKVQYIDAPDEENRKYKTSVYKYSPFQKTLYLDADTEVFDDISFGFHFLERADMAIRPLPSLMNNISTEAEPEKTYLLARKWGEFNGGVFFFQKNRDCEILFRTWYDDIEQNNLKRDQKALIRSIAKNRNISIWPLGPAWNYTRYDYKNHKSYKEQKRLSREPFIWHYINFSYSIKALSDVVRISKGNEDFWNKVISFSFLKTFILVPFIERWIPGGSFILKSISNTKKVLQKIFSKKIKEKT